MTSFDINVLPWMAQRQRYWKRQRHWWHWAVIMSVGWAGCGHLWHDCWRNYLAAQWIAQQQQLHDQRQQHVRDGEQRLAAEQWRQQALEHQRTRLVAERHLVGLWQTLEVTSLSVRTIDWAPERVQVVLGGLSHHSASQVRDALLAVNIVPQCQALSADRLHCEWTFSEQPEQVESVHD